MVYDMPIYGWIYACHIPLESSWSQLFNDAILSSTLIALRQWFAIFSSRYNFQVYSTYKQLATIIILIIMFSYTYTLHEHCLYDRKILYWQLFKVHCKSLSIWVCAGCRIEKMSCIDPFMFCFAWYCHPPRCITCLTSSQFNAIYIGE